MSEPRLNVRDLSDAQLKRLWDAIWSDDPELAEIETAITNNEQWMLAPLVLGGCLPSETVQ